MAPLLKKKRSCRQFTGSTYFKPRGIPLSSLEITNVALDELEAMHLCDHEDLSQADAAQRMGISTSTLQRILYSGRNKIIDALYSSKAIEIFRPDQVTEVVNERHRKAVGKGKKMRNVKTTKSGDKK